MIRVLGVSGSLRARSSNTEALLAVALLAPDGVEVRVCSALGALPAFNPDLDGEGMVPPSQVVDFRSQVARADALLISTPEYAHGVPGMLKNALDWLVSFAGVVHMPVAILNISPRSRHAPASLAETLRTMSMRVVPSGEIALLPSEGGPRASTLVRDPEFSATVHRTLDALTAAVWARPSFNGSRSL